MQLLVKFFPLRIFETFRTINLDTDSMVCVWALGSWKAKSPVLSFILKEIAVECILKGIELSPSHWPGEENIIADAISRYDRHCHNSKYRKVVDMLCPSKQIKFKMNKDLFRQSLNPGLKDVFKFL